MLARSAPMARPIVSVSPSLVGQLSAWFTRSGDELPHEILVPLEATRGQNRAPGCRDAERGPSAGHGFHSRHTSALGQQCPCPRLEMNVDAGVHAGLEEPSRQRAAHAHEARFCPLLHQGEIEPLGMEDAIHLVELAPRQRHPEPTRGTEALEPLTEQ